MGIKMKLNCLECHFSKGLTLGLGFDYSSRLFSMDQERMEILSLSLRT